MKVRALHHTELWWEDSAQAALHPDNFPCVGLTVALTWQEGPGGTSLALCDQPKPSYLAGPA